MSDTDNLNFKQLLLAEFSEQHNNIRQTEASAIQLVQYALATEGILIAGVIALIASNMNTNQLPLYIALIFWFAALMGHFVISALMSMMLLTNKIDLQNTLVRLYLAPEENHKIYLMFIKDEESELSWKNMEGNIPSMKKFAVLFNNLNIIVATLATLSVFVPLAALITQIEGLIGTPLKPAFIILITSGIVIVISVVLHFVYQWIVGRFLEKKIKCDWKKTKKTHKKKLIKIKGLPPNQVKETPLPSSRDK